MTVTIIGAGMAGLLAANMLHRHDPVVWEASEELPNNHSAVLRFRSSVVGDVLGIPFREVNVIKDVLPWKNPVADALAYSAKNTGVMRSDRSVTAGLTVAKRFIAPPDLIQQMAARVKIVYGKKWEHPDQTDRGPTISTIPMASMSELMGNVAPPFAMEWSPAVNVTAKVDQCDAYVSLLIPDPEIHFSRVSITGDELIVEVPKRSKTSTGSGWPETYAYQAAGLLGFGANWLTNVRSHQSRYAKILPVPEGPRREFIYHATTAHNIYSLGRYATWRPGLMLDDLVADIRKIERWLDGKSNYERAQGR